MIRVIHYLPSINCTSGIANLLMNYYRLIDKTKIQFNFIYFSMKTNNNFEEEIKQMGGNVTYIAPPTKYKSFRKNLNNYIKKLKIQHPKDNIIFQNHQLAFTLFLYNILKKNEINNFIVHNHMTKFSDNIFKSFRNMILFIPVRLLKVKYFSCSEDACNLIHRYNGINREKIFIMNNGIDCDKFMFNDKARKKIRDEYNLSDSFVIGHIGRFEPVKNHEFIIKIFEKILKQEKNCKLVLVGNGKLKNKIIEFSKEKYLDDKIVFLELRQDIPDLLSSMDCFVFPSKFEGLGIAAIEAQANGVPTLISDKVPSQVKIYNCTQLGLYDIDTWVNQIIKINKNNTNKNRKDSNYYVKKSIFNITKNVKNVENEYYKIAKKGL